MRSEVLGIVIVVALLAGGFLFFASENFLPQAEGVPVAMNVYANGVYGISFSYPTDYILSENAGEDVYAITLIHESDAVPRVGSEGPTSIGIVISELPRPDMTLDEWLTSATLPAPVEETNVDGQRALRFRSTGLYESETTLFTHDGHLISASVTFISPSDPIYGAYQQILGSLKLR